MKKSAHDVFNRNCLQTGLKPDIPTLDAAILEGIKRFHLFNLPATAFSVPDFDETLAAYLPYPIFKVASLGRTPKESKKVFPSTADSIRLLHAYADSEQALYIELEDRLMKAARIGSRQKFMEMGLHLFLPKEPKSTPLLYSSLFLAPFKDAPELCKPLRILIGGRRIHVQRRGVRKSNPAYLEKFVGSQRSSHS